MEYKRGFIFLNNKKAGTDVLSPQIMVTILNLIFFAILLAFIYRSSQGGLIYEQAYAKEIAMLIDEAKPGMDISFKMDKGIELVEKNNKDKNKIVSIDKNKVIVDLSGKGGYSFEYFSDYNVKTSFDEKENVLKIMVGNKNV